MKRIFSLALVLALLTSTLFADEVRVSFENDVFFKTDSWYTHGTLISYTFVVDPTEHWLIDDTVTYRKASFGQYMYTPADITVPELIEEDRPYAGLIYGELTEYMESENRMQSISILLGVVGPYSFADETQIFVHEKITDSSYPKGWDNQLDDEPVVNVGYADRHRLLDSKWWDWIGRYGISVGNLNTHASIGTTFKFGWNVPPNYDIVSLEPVPRDYEVQMNGYPVLGKAVLIGFVDLEGAAVAHNILLDGNTFSDSHSVDKEPLVGGLVAGITLGITDFEITYSMHWRTKEFEGQEHTPKYGGLSLSYRF